MVRQPLRVTEVQPGQLIIAEGDVRVRVSSTLTNTNRKIVIVYGRSVRGEVGIPHAIDAEVVRLV